jgi:ribonucleoside-triphosphate reductase
MSKLLFSDSNNPLIFTLPDVFVEHYVGRQPKWGPVGYVTYKRTYARPLKTGSLYDRHINLAKTAGLLVSETDDGKYGTEEYWLTCTRVVEGTFSVLRTHCKNLNVPWDDAKGIRDAEEMFRLMWEFKFLPPGRGLFVMGSPIVEKKGAGALNNCAFISTKDIDKNFAEPFCFLMDFSALGVGVGSDVRGAGKIEICKPTVDENYTFIVEDSREGWVTLLRTVLSAYADTECVMPGKIDYSRIRKRGTLLKTFGGTASGPSALIELIDDIKTLLNRRAGHLILSSDIVDINNMIGRCIVAGNSRRSAEIMFGDTTDEAFLELKDPTKFPKELSSYRWASNNSVFATVGQSYDKVGSQTAKNGEPGYFWLENAKAYGRMGHGEKDNKDAEALGGNPCLEQTLHNYELCTLVETFPELHDGLNDYLHTLKYAYMYAKTVTLIPTHYMPTNAVLLKNRRIGCSMSGIVQAIKKFGRHKFFTMCDAGYNFIQRLDEEYSGWMCVPRSIKTTSVKPSGTTSLLPGQTPGIHSPESEYYMRVIRFAKDSWMLEKLRNAGYQCIDIDENKEPNTCAVYFPVKVECFDRAERDVSMWEQLELAAAMQHYWADNQVSVTVKFNPEREGHDIPRALEYYQTKLKGVSFLPDVEMSYEHMPYQTITREQWEEASSKITELDLGETSHEVTESFCDGTACEWRPNVKH